jgi:hypothetical protein
MNRTVTLRQNDSINLTTGEVTRRSCQHLTLPRHRDGLAMNDLESLLSAIKINALHGALGMYSVTFGDVYPPDGRVCANLERCEY